MPYPLSTNVRKITDSAYLCAPSSPSPDPIPSLPCMLYPLDPCCFHLPSTTGSRDPVTSALHIVVGDRMPLDIVRLTSWAGKGEEEEEVEETPTVRYAASFAGWGGGGGDGVSGVYGSGLWRIKGSGNSGLLVGGVLGLRMCGFMGLWV